MQNKHRSTYQTCDSVMKLGQTPLKEKKER